MRKRKRVEGKRKRHAVTLNVSSKRNVKLRPFLVCLKLLELGQFHQEGVKCLCPYGGNIQSLLDCSEIPSSGDVYRPRVLGWQKLPRQTRPKAADKKLMIMTFFNIWKKSIARGSNVEINGICVQMIGRGIWAEAEAALELFEQSWAFWFTTWNFGAQKSRFSRFWLPTFGTSFGGKSSCPAWSAPGWRAAWRFWVSAWGPVSRKQSLGMSEELKGETTSWGFGKFGKFCKSCHFCISQLFKCQTVKHCRQYAEKAVGTCSPVRDSFCSNERLEASR